MATIIDKISKRIHVFLQRKHKEHLLRQSRRLAGRKLLTLDPPNFWTALKSTLFHPLEFIKSGIAGAYQSEYPVITHPGYKKILNEPLYRYVWNYYHNKEFLHSIKWMGVHAFKNIFDLWIYQEIIFEKKPDWIVEIGSYYGGSTLYLAHMQQIAGSGKVISVDINRKPFCGGHERIIEIEGDSSSREVFDKIRSLTAGGTVMIIHDGDHSEEAALRDLRLYAPLVSRGHYFIMEDGIFDLFDSKRAQTKAEQTGPMKAVEKFVNEQPGVFTVDLSREKFTLTSNPHGFLLRNGD